MNARNPLPIAVLASFLIHIGVLVWPLQQVRVAPPRGQGFVDVFLAQTGDEHGRRRLLPQDGTALAHALRRPAQPAPAIPAVAEPPQAATASAGPFHWQAPAPSSPDRSMNAMQQALIANQRASRAAAVFAGLSNLSARLSPVLTGRIVCSQDADRRFECTPAPGKEADALLTQLFGLALEARRLGLAENPMRVDFGPEQGVSIIFPP